MRASATSGSRRSTLAGELARGVRGKPWYTWLASLGLWLLATVLAVLLADEIVPGFRADSPVGHWVSP
jgi:hypothetical protein